MHGSRTHADPARRTATQTLALVARMCNSGAAQRERGIDEALDAHMASASKMRVGPSARVTPCTGLSRHAVATTESPEETVTSLAGELGSILVA